MAFYLISIGGTGAKCTDAVIHLASVGLFDNNTLKILFIDPDEDNGNLARTQSNLKFYQSCYQIITGDKKQCSWMKTPIESFGLWSPLTKSNTNINLSSYFNYNHLQENHPELSNLFDILYTQEERTIDLDCGFRGRAAIGSAIMSQIDFDSLDEEPWRSLIGQIQADVGQGIETKVLLCGSIVGGTGASGLPTIGRLLANKLRQMNVRARIKIGCIFMLPYFDFSLPPKADYGDIESQSDLFLLNTENALHYYANQLGEIFDTVYLLGNHNNISVKFSLGRNSQDNQPHFLELYAALAARQFFLYPCNEQRPITLIARQDLRKVTWNDIPEQNVVKPELVNATRFAYAWLAYTLPQLNSIQNQGISLLSNNIAWSRSFFRQRTFLGNTRKDLPEVNNPTEQERMNLVSNWCQTYLNWLYFIHESDDGHIQLFAFRSFLQPQLEEFSSLVIDDSRDEAKRKKDTIPALHTKLNLVSNSIFSPNQGVAGLVTSLYRLCRL